MTRVLPCGVIFALLWAAAASTAADPLPGFKLDGTRWSYADKDLKMEGFLNKPEGQGPFPAILISHGMGGSGEQIGTLKAKEFVKWGFVCIAPSYTHSQPKGADNKAFGASPENLKRAVKCLDILASLPEVDAKRIGAYGNSMGAFVTIGLAAEAPDRLKAAAITAGGIASKAGFPAPSSEAAGKIRTPFLILHGTADTTVRPEQSASLKEVLDQKKTTNERQLFEGVGHGLHTEKADEVYQLMRGWFQKHGVIEK